MCQKCTVFRVPTEDKDEDTDKDKFYSNKTFRTKNMLHTWNQHKDVQNIT